MQRRIACALPIALVLAGCGRTPDPRGVARDEVLLQVAATGRTETRPDEARFSAGVSTIGATAAAASTGNATAMTRVVAAVEALGVRGEDVQTRSITLSRIDYGPNRGRFEANNVVTVRVRDLTKAGTAIAAASEAGANILSGPDLRVSDPDAADRQAYAQAYKAARARAEVYAKAAGMRVARVLVIRDGGVVEPPITYGYASAEAMSAPPRVSAPPIRGGTDERSVTIRADFALKPD